MLRWSRTEIACVFRERGIRAKKFLGQNFIVDENFIEAIVREVEIAPGDGIVEIGAGLGSVTERLARKAGHVWAFEIDPKLYTLSLEAFGKLPNVTFVNRDGAEFARHPGIHPPLKLVSNLPYSDYYRILLRIMDARMPLDGLYLMLQRDVVERLVASPGDDAYGPISVLVQVFFEFTSLRKARREIFYPLPRVESVFFRLRRKGRSLVDILRLEKGLRALFASRRKQLRAIGSRLGVPLAERFPEHAKQRVEALEPGTLIEMARLLG